MTATTDCRLLTRSEVEERFGIPKRYLEVASSKGTGPPIIRIGRMVRYAPRDIVEWIEANRTVPSRTHTSRAGRSL